MRQGGPEKALERYLNSACSGLFGLERQTVRDELEANLLERVREFQVMGFVREVALERALEEFGAPGRVSRGMREVYVLPNLLKGGAFLGVLALGAYLALSSSVALPLSLTYDGPCRENCAWMGMSYVSVNSLERELHAQGVRVTRDAKVMHATFPNGSSGQVTVQVNGAGRSDDAIFQRNAETYVPVGELLNLAYSAKLPIHLSSLVNPTLTIGGVKLALENKARPINLSYQMSVLVAEWLCSSKNKRYARNPANEKISVCTGLSTWNPANIYIPTFRLRLGKPHALYAVLLPSRSSGDLQRLLPIAPYPDSKKTIQITQAANLLQVLEADANGVLHIPDPRDFATGTQQNRLPDFATSAKEFAGGKSGKALLLELSGRLDFGGQNYRVVERVPALEKVK